MPGPTMSRRLRRSSWDTCSLRVRTEGARILDLCAAPGGKTTLYASLAGPDGLVVANEIDRRRALGAGGQRPQVGYGQRGRHDLRAACAGRLRGVVRRGGRRCPLLGRGDVPQGPRRPRRMERGQREAVRRAAGRDPARGVAGAAAGRHARCTAPARSTATRTKARWSGCAAWAGDEIAESEETAVEDAWGIVCGRVGAFRTFRFYPHRTCGEGFFAAVARKSLRRRGARCRAPKARRTVFAAGGPEDRRRAAPAGCGIAGAVCASRRWPTPATHGTPRRPTPCRTLAEALPVIYAGVAMGQVFKGVPAARSRAGVLRCG